MSYKVISLFIGLLFSIQPLSTYAANLDKDPTKPAAYNTSASVKQAEGQSPFVVSAVLKKGQTLMAVVNNKPVSKGSEIAGWTVVEITQQHVAMKLNEIANSQVIEFKVSEQINVKK